MKIYTRTGDDGTTSLFGGKRVSKAGDRVEAYGVVDEANSILGLARAMKLDPWSDEVLQKIQRDLFTLGAEIASGRNAQSKLRMPLIGSTKPSSSWRLCTHSSCLAVLLPPPPCIWLEP